MSNTIDCWLACITSQEPEAWMHQYSTKDNNAVHMEAALACVHMLGVSGMIHCRSRHGRSNWRRHRCRTS